MIDFHTHILPGIDDGSSSPEETEAILTSMKAQGIDTVVATPHFYADENNPERFDDNRWDAWEKIEDIAAKLDMEILLGAEVHFFTNISKVDLDVFLVEDTDLLLLEMPFCEWTPGMVQEVLHLSEKCQVVLAHIERYFNWQPPRKKVWKELEEAGVLFQINATGLIHKDTRSKLLKLLKNDQIAFIATDSHNMKSRPPRMKEALSVVYEKLGDDTWKKQIMKSRRILNEHFTD